MNTALRRTKQEKNDEYYTLLEDIENELSHYPPAFSKTLTYTFPATTRRKANSSPTSPKTSTASNSANSPQPTTRRAPQAP